MSNQNEILDVTQLPDESAGLEAALRPATLDEFVGQEKLKDNWRVGDTLNLSIGQGFLNVTPIQIVKAVAEIANGGYPIQPQLIKEDTIPNIQNQKPLFKKHHLFNINDVLNRIDI